MDSSETKTAAPELISDAAEIDFWFVA